MPAIVGLSTATQRLLSELTEELVALEAGGLRRQLRTLEAVDGPRVRLEGRELVNWCSNDSLGLSRHPRLAEAAASAAAEWGLGARASRLLSGTTRWHRELEEALARWFGVEAALVYPSGYLANLGALGALCSSQDLIVMDRLSHASLFDAARASRATVRVFRHHDAGHAATLLARGRGARRRLIVTEGVFSMEGDRAPLADLAEAAQAQEALVYVDDAHGAFALGRSGRGSPEAAGLSPERFLYMGTLGKALGCQGGFIIGPRPLIEWLHNRSRPFIYTTALATPVVAAAAAALQVLEEEPHRRLLLEARAQALASRLAALGLPLAAPSHIVPVIAGDAERAVAWSRRLWDRGIWAPAIRPPTVPEGTARLRLSLTALHTEEHLDALIDALKDVLPRVRSSELGVRSKSPATPHSALRTPHSGSGG
ncbi:MAG: 8-amino-7-oxononanoate synthase [Candidatus Omnitrophica bacterium]|nr:8-amino-7-oxononanoate synthase [Candidatus Omnitrophota bacterium]